MSSLGPGYDVLDFISFRPPELLVPAKLAFCPTVPWRTNHSERSLDFLIRCPTVIASTCFVDTDMVLVNLAT